MPANNDFCCIADAIPENEGYCTLSSPIEVFIYEISANVHDRSGRPNSTSEKCCDFKNSKSTTSRRGPQPS